APHPAVARGAREASQALLLSQMSDKGLSYPPCKPARACNDIHPPNSLHARNPFCGRICAVAWDTDATGKRLAASVRMTCGTGTCSIAAATFPANMSIVTIAGRLP